MLAKILRAIFYTCRGILVMVALLWLPILLTLVPALLRGGVRGLQGKVAHIALTGVPLDLQLQRDAIHRTYLALLLLSLLPLVLWMAQHFLGRMLRARPGA